MSLLDIMVDQALASRPELAQLRVAVEKEILHQDILRILGDAGFLKGLVFMGGTCLRLCHGSNRLSEDLDFAGGRGFTRQAVVGLGRAITDGLSRKYGLAVTVSEPTRETGDTDTWRIRIQTRPERRDIPAQRINLDICAVPGRDPQPQMIRDLYGIATGAPGLVLQAESRGEIFVDKLIAFALRRGRIKHRDIWDIGWMVQQSVKPRMDLLTLKLDDHGSGVDAFLPAFDERVASLSNPEMASGFRDEMQRFLPSAFVARTVDDPHFWTWMIGVMSEQRVGVRNTLTGAADPAAFPM
ncbi:MAG TPA: nucleotidyl transferase AbiEii/AbiGii toxin family protein [Myxococcota bacterium]|nr:nucleotidyl transferase AbiEii/AbiGii toxin family protein [Myxococcota bacterium]HOH77763.1 nucleotidyl transferase AbiEii/AbiGii toxin family protein [Myxococcota bacterium]